METETDGRNISRSTDCRQTKTIPCRTGERANSPEVGEAHSSYVRRSMTNHWVGIVSLQVGSEEKAVGRLGDNISSDQTYTMFRSTLVPIQRARLTRTRSSCNKMDQTGMKEPIPSRNRSCPETNSIPCCIEGDANLQEVDGEHSSCARRSTTNH